MVRENKPVWYVNGLHFQCAACGNCCSGPCEGYVWVTAPEIKFIADFLKSSKEKLNHKYLRQVGLRYSILEQPINKDCIFLQKTGSGKQCVIYSVRPNQCRTWPFWPENLYSPDAWNEAVRRCPGMNRGKLYNCGEIGKSLASKVWWKNDDKSAITK